MHADQLTRSGASQLAAELGAATADHLEQVDELDIRALAQAGVQPVLLPASVYCLGRSKYPPARQMIEAGLAIVLATDFNPGSSPTPSIPFVLSLASTQMRMTPAEAITATTINAAYSLGRGDQIGSLEPGKRADFVIHDCSDYREISYFVGVESAACGLHRRPMCLPETRGWLRSRSEAGCRTFSIAMESLRAASRSSLMRMDGSLASRNTEIDLAKAQRLPNRALLPGLVNAHSHTFQRVIRARTEYRTRSPKDTFWTWREAMYHAALRLSPEDVYCAARMAFLEMALSGITAVGEFHYLHHAADGTPYDDRNLLAKQILRARPRIGIRIALLRTAYVRAGWRKELEPGQARFHHAAA